MKRQFLLDTILTYETCHENILECLLLSGVEFLSNFGPWERGQKVACLTFNFETGYAYSTDDEGHKISEMKFTLTTFNETDWKPCCHPDAGCSNPENHVE